MTSTAYSAVQISLSETHATAGINTQGNTGTATHGPLILVPGYYAGTVMGFALAIIGALEGQDIPDEVEQSLSRDSETGWQG